MRDALRDTWRRFRGTPVWFQVATPVVLAVLAVGLAGGAEESADRAPTTATTEESATTSTRRTTTTRRETTTEGPTTTDRPTTTRAPTTSTTRPPRTTTTRAPTTAAPPTTLGPPEPGSGSERLRREHFGDAWPLSVDEVILRCEGDAVTITSGGTTWAVNGTALTRMEAEGWEDVREGDVWPEIPGGGGLRRDIGVLIDRGLELC